MKEKITIGTVYIVLAFSVMFQPLYSQVNTNDAYLDSITNEETYLSFCSESNDKITDLLVMYHGGAERLKYTKDELRSYVYRYNAAGEFEWLFDGYLFLEDRTDIGTGHAFEQHAYLFQKDRARKTEWKWLLDRIFTPGESVSALNDLIDEMAFKEAVPARKRKVILSIPEPLSGQLGWGSLDGRPLDFANDSDRVDAVKWYIDELATRFDAKEFDHLELSGFYWLRSNDELTFQLMPIIASYIKSKGYKFYWRPSYRRFRGDSWREHGFDAAYLTPDHLTTSAFKKVNVDRACTYASLNNMGLELDLNNLVRRFANYRTKFYDYMSVYTENNVFDKAAMSFQDGHGIFHEMSQSDNEELKAIYNHVLDVVAERQKRADTRCK